MVELRDVILNVVIYDTRDFSPLVELGSKEQDPVKVWAMSAVAYGSL